MQSIFSFTKDKLATELSNLGIKPFVATQIFEWIYKKRIKQWDEMRNVSASNVAKIKETFTIDELKTDLLQKSLDGTVKILSRLSDDTLVETVIMQFEYGNSACVTTQVGCNMGCGFCASGQLRKQRNLTVSEMVLQLVRASDILAEEGKRLSHYVVMGIGEPFDNYDNLIDFLEISKEQHGLGIGARHITVSTCGIVPRIRDFASDQPQVNLAVSLHAPNNAIRDSIMPVNRRYPLEQLIPAVRDYISQTKRRITYEYILLDGVNDRDSDAEALAELVQGQLSFVNLIPYNPVLGSKYRRTKNANSFFRILNAHGIPCTIRKEKGIDIDAACGQLRAKEMQSSKTPKVPSH